MLVPAAGQFYPQPSLSANNVGDRFGSAVSGSGALSSVLSNEC
ncbi:hypothetical protein [Nostoc sp. CENA543]|nr:hypothetical protein [Nostoc sp. CENA543]